MALAFAHGVIHWLAADAPTTTYSATTTDVVSGQTFQPKALRFYWVGIHSATDAVTATVSGRRGVGFAVSTSSRRSVGTFSEDAVPDSNCGAVACNDCIAVTTNGAGARDGLLDLNAITSGGFQLIVDDQVPVNITVCWEAWGGDITAAVVGDIAEPAATGDVDYTVNGFVAAATDQVVMFAGCQSVSALNTAEAQDSGLHVGFSSGPSNNVTFCGNSDDASATTDTDGYARGDECLSMIVIAGGLTPARATLTQFGTDNFRLNWIARATTDRRSIFMAIKGGQWTAGSYTIDSTTVTATATVSGLSYPPIGVSVIGGALSQATAGTAQSGDYLSLGTATSTSSRMAVGYRDLALVADSNIGLAVEYDQLFVMPLGSAASLIYSCDLNAMNSDGFQVIVDASSGALSATAFHVYLAFGATLVPIGTPPATTSGARMNYHLRNKQRFLTQ